MRILLIMIKIIFFVTLSFLTCSVHSWVNNNSYPHYELVHWRDGNDLFLYCNSAEPYSANVLFRINDSEPIYFGSSKSPGATSGEILEALAVLPALHLGLVKFTLLPQYEGTYFCGNPSTDVWSEGVGPLVANPVFVDENYARRNQSIETTNGENVTIVCPVLLGKLVQFYDIQWLGIVNKSNKFVNNTGKYSTLTLINVQDQDYKTYQCKVTTTNRIDGTKWDLDADVTLQNKFDWKHQIFLGFQILGWMFILALILTLFCTCCLCITCFADCREQKSSLKTVDMESGCKGDFILHRTTSLVSTDPPPTYNSTLTNEIGAIPLQVRTECIDGLRLIKDHCIGTGAFGTVFKGTYQGRICAAKMLTHHAQFFASGIDAQPNVQELALKSFHKECKFLKELSHKNVVEHITTIPEPTSNLPILVMELMDCSLKSYLEKCQPQQLPILFQISLFLDISRGLKFLHSKDLIHRDICDDNVLLDVKSDIPRAKISDFGMSRLIPHDCMSSTLSALGHRQIYLPQEAAKYPIKYTDTLDVYALGVLGLQIAVVEIRVRNCNDLLVKLSENHLLRNIIIACLRENGHDRPNSSEVVNMITSLQ